MEEEPHPSAEDEAPAMLRSRRRSSVAGSNVKGSVSDTSAAGASSSSRRGVFIFSGPSSSDSRSRSTSLSRKVFIELS